MAKKPEMMATSGGNPVADHRNSVTPGLRGPLMITGEIVHRLHAGAVKGEFLAGRS